jgi:hypothetical protein
LVKKLVAARVLLNQIQPVTGLATEMFLGDPARFADGNALASYVGKSGNPLARVIHNVIESRESSLQSSSSLQNLSDN